MQLLLFSLLAIFCSSILAIDCSSGSDRVSLVKDASAGTDCLTGCLDSSAVTVTWAQIQAAAGDRSSETSTALLEAYKTACVALNPALSSCGSNFITFDTSADVCTCPICDQTDKCAIINSWEASCYKGECTEKECTTTEYTDADTGITNTLAEITTVTSTDCESCTSGSGTGTRGDATAEDHECEKEDRPLVDDSFCWYKCVADSSGIRRMEAYDDIKDLRGVSYGLEKLKAVCKGRNTELDTSFHRDIVPLPFSDAALGCGCGIVVERCLSEDPWYRLSQEDDGSTTCTKRSCEINEVPITYDAITYTNLRKTETTETVDSTFCESGSDSTGSDYEPPATSECSNSDLCAGKYGDDVVCVTLEDDTVFTTCRDKVKCLQYDDTSGVEITSGRCGADQVTEDECVLGEVSVSSAKAATSACPKICKCIENPAGSDLGNVVRCASIEKEAAFRILKEECPDEFGDDECQSGRLYYDECPDSTDADICEKVFCDTELDPNDFDNGGVCRKSSEGFEDEDIVLRNSTHGCKFCECARDGTNERRCKRYDLDTTTSEGILDRCPELADCTNSLQFHTRGVCGACPVCAPGDGEDNDCDGAVLRSGDDACKEDPRNEPTRPDAEEIAGRVAVTVGVSACVDDLLGMTRFEAYGRIKTAAFSLVEEECTNIDSFVQLRVHVVGFEYEIEEAVADEACDILASVVVDLHFSDTTLERLEALLVCFANIAEASDVSLKIRDRLAAVSANTDLEATDDNSTDIETTDVDDTFYAELGTDPGIELLDADGLTLSFDTTTSGDDMDDTATTARGGGGEDAAAAFGILGAIGLSWIALLF